MTAAEADIHSSGLDGRVWLLWLQMVVQEVGGYLQRGQLFSTLAMVAVIAAVVAVAGWMIIDESELRFCDLSRCGWPCAVVSCSGSCARLPEAFRTLGGCVLTYAARRTRTCAAAVAAWPL